ncbi:glucokinase [Porphyromonas gingivalis]|nr:glucokinase [Porphyromonas gingivalis]
MEKPYVLGVDVGGTNTVFGVVDARGNLVISSSIKTGAHNDLNDYIKDLTAGINQLIEQVGGKEKIKGIGVGAPNGNYVYRIDRVCAQFALETDQNTLRPNAHRFIRYPHDTDQ